MSGNFIIPVEPTPPGQVSNFIDPPSQAWMPRLSIYTTLPLSVIFLCFRLSARFQKRQRLHIEDYLCVAATFAITGFCTTVLIETNDGVFGRHFWDIPVAAFTATIYQETLAITLLYTLSAMLIKQSLLVFFHRIFSPNPVSRVMAIVGIVFVTVSYPISIAVWIYENVPHAGEMGWLGLKFLTRTPYPDAVISVTLGALGSVTDLYIITIPFISITGLNLSNRRKLGLLALFATGLLACGFSIASLVARVGIYKVLNGIPDSFWTSMQPYALAAAEINLGIVCSCVPIAASLLKSWAEKLSSIRTRQKTKTSPTYSPDAAPPRLPSVVKGTLSTLLSFVRGSRRNPQTRSAIMVTHNTDVEMAVYDEIEATETDYNMHLRSMQLESRRNLVGSTADASKAS